MSKLAGGDIGSALSEAAQVKVVSDCIRILIDLSIATGSCERS